MGTESRWAAAGVEAPLEEIMSDPIVALILRRDGLTQAAVWEFLALARDNRARTPQRAAVSPAVPTRRGPR